MYITVLYGEREEGIFNPNCKCVCLLNTIRDKCLSHEWNAEIDLSDTQGNLKSLNEFPNKYASDLLEEREKLVLIRIDKRGADTKYTPLLNDNETLTEKFYSNLTSKQQEMHSGRRHKSSKSRDSATKDAKSNHTKHSKPKPLSRTSSKLSLKLN